ncbi:hypothetical protein JCM10207_002471 [Rhodosporidiobolus poonsookiae]
MVTHNQAGIDFDQHPPRTADGRDANKAVFNQDKRIAHSSLETDKHKKAAQAEMHRFEEAERKTAEGYSGTILNPARSDSAKLAAAEKLVHLPHWTDESRRERREHAAADAAAEASGQVAGVEEGEGGTGRRGEEKIGEKE